VNVPRGNHNAPMDEHLPRSWKLGIGLLTAVLWLAAIGSAAFWIMRFLDSSKPAAANAREASTPPAQAINWPALSARFGAEQKAATVASDIKVLGIVLPPHMARARAVLMIESTKSTIVAEVGKEIEDGPLRGAVIERITAKEVLLNRSQGNTQTLAVPDAKDAKHNGLVTITPAGYQGLAKINQAPSAIPSNSMPIDTNSPNAAAAAVQAARAAAMKAQEAQMPPPPAPMMNPGMQPERQTKEQR
jgi:hypothetical protein